MKKVIIIMMAVLLATLLVVSCKADVNAQEDRLSSVTVDSVASRGFTSTIASNVDPIDSLDWYYTAVKTDGGLFVTGQKTDLTAIGTGNSLGQLSWGTWSFTFKLVKHGAGSSAAAVYEGSLTNVEVSGDSTELHVHLNQGDAVGTAKVVFDALSFDVGNLAINNTQGGVFKLEVMENNTAIFATAGSDAYDNGVTFTLTGLTTEKAYDAAGAHTYEFVVYYKPANGNWTEVTTTSYTVYIPLGITMTISGSVEAIESTSAVTATGSIHHYAIDDVGAWYCDYSDCDQLLAGTNAAYITVLASDGQPTEIIPLTNGLHRGVGSGTIVVSGNNVTYENTSGVAQTVVIRTTSSDAELTITAGTDVVKHYDHAGSLTINAIAGNSYHENGSVAFVEIKTGRIVLESNSDIEHIHLMATAGATSSDAYFDGITVAKASTVEMPEFSRDAVEIPDEGRLVVALQDGTESTDAKDYVWLTAVGVYEQVTVSDSATDAGYNYAADLSSDAQVKKDAAQQIANSITFSEGGNDYKVTAATTDGGHTWTYNVVNAETPTVVSTQYTASESENTVTVTYTSSTEQVITTFENGTEKEEKKSEFIATLIMTEAELNEFFSGKYVNGKLGANIELSASAVYLVSTGEKNLDFNSFTVTNAQMKTSTGGKLALVGGGKLINNSASPIIVQGGSLSLGITVQTEGYDAIALEEAEFSLTLCGATVETDGYPLFPTAPGTIIIADDTENLLSSYNAAAILFIAHEEFADENDNVYWSIVGQDKGNGILRTESNGYGIQLYGADADCDLTLNHFYADICGEETAIYEGAYNHAIMKNMSGGFSDDQTRFCEPGYFTEFDQTTGRYVFNEITESNASLLVKNGDNSVYAVNFVQALLLAEDGATIELLKDVNNATTFERVTAENITIDLKGNTLTSSTTIGVNRNSSFNSNVCATIHVTFKNGKVNSDVRFEENANVEFEDVDFINGTSSLKKILLYSDLNRKTYTEADPSYQSMTFKNCSFTDYYFEFTGSSEAQEMDVSFVDCSFDKGNYTSNYSDNSLIKFGNYYGYGILSLNGCTINANLKYSYNYAVEVNTYASYIDGESITVTITDTTINVTGGCTKPVNAGTWTVTQEGTNVYTVGGTAKNYDGTAIEQSN